MFSNVNIWLDCNFLIDKLRLKTMNGQACVNCLKQVKIDRAEIAQTNTFVAR